MQHVMQHEISEDDTAPDMNRGISAYRNRVKGEIRTPCLQQVLLVTVHSVISNYFFSIHCDYILTWL